MPSLLEDTMEVDRQALSAVDRVSAATVSHAYANLGAWVRKTDYKLTQDEWIWLNQARMSVLRRQVTYGGLTFASVLGVTQVKFSINGGPARRLPGWARWGFAGTAAWMASGLGKLNGHRTSMKRLMLIPDSALGDHMRASLSLPPLTAQAGGGATEFADLAGEPAPPALTRASGGREEREQQLRAAAAGGLTGRSGGVSTDGTFPPPATIAPADSSPLEQEAPPPLPRARPAFAKPERPNSWDRVRQERMEQHKQQQQTGAVAARTGPRGQGDELPAQMRGDGSVEAGLPRVLGRKNRWGDKVFTDTVD